MNYNQKGREIPKRRAQPISSEDVEKAIAEHRENGGLIKRLPDEIVPKRLLVGAKYGAYDGVIFSGFNPVPEEEMYKR